MIDREKLRQVARISFDKGTVDLSYAGRTVSAHRGETPAKLSSVIERLLDELLPHVEAVFKEVAE